MATISASQFFGGKVPPPPTETVLHTPEGPKPSLFSRITSNAEKVTDTLGLHNAIDTLGDDLATMRDPRAALEGRINPLTLKKQVKAGVNLGLAVPAPELGGVGLKAGAKGASATVKLAGQGVEKTGQKIQQSVIRPSVKDIADGFNIENVAKYDVGGSLPETIAKVHTKMNELGQQLAEKLKGSNVKVNLAETLHKTAERLATDKHASFGDNAALDRVLDQIADEVKRVGGDAVDLVNATNIKRGAGNKGAWAYNRPEADASAIERAYTEFYAVLKEQIEKAAPAGVKEINKQLSELIPIQNAALRRLPVEQRNNVFSLTDSIGFMSALFDPKALLLVGASKAARSGKVGETLVNAGRKLQGKR